MVVAADMTILNLLPRAIPVMGSNKGDMASKEAATVKINLKEVGANKAEVVVEVDLQGADMEAANKVATVVAAEEAAVAVMVDKAVEDMEAVAAVLEVVETVEVLEEEWIVALGDGNLVIQHDTVFVSGMDPSFTEDDIADHFGSIGIVKMDRRTNKKKVWLYKDKNTGLSKGEATVTYDDADAAQSAIKWFDGKDFRGSVIKGDVEAVVVAEEVADLVEAEEVAAVVEDLEEDVEVTEVGVEVAAAEVVVIVNQETETGNAVILNVQILTLPGETSAIDVGNRNPLVVVVAVMTDVEVEVETETEVAEEVVVAAADSVEVTEDLAEVAAAEAVAVLEAVVDLAEVVVVAAAAEEVAVEGTEEVGTEDVLNLTRVKFTYRNKYECANVIFVSFIIMY
ncbi:hypothetical protein HUJ04_001669 [Dendroctonus ponderosae]